MGTDSADSSSDGVYIQYETLDGDSKEYPLSRGGTEWWTTSLIIAAIILGLGVLGTDRLVRADLTECDCCRATLRLQYHGLGTRHADDVPFCSRCRLRRNHRCAALVRNVEWLHSLAVVSAVHQEIENMDTTPHGYSDIGQAAYGNKGYTAVRIVQYGFLGGCLVAVQLTASKSLVTVVQESGSDLCLVTANLIIALCMLPVMQLQSLGQAGTYAMIPGIVSILIPLIIILAQLSSNGKQQPGTTVGFPDSSGFKLFAHGFTTIAFAFQGQQILPELRSEMRCPEEFPKAVYGSVGVMMLVYFSVVVPGYYYMGNDAVYLMDALEGHATTNGVSNGSLIIHVLMGYVINGNVMNKAIHALISSEESTQGQDVDRKSWFGATCITLSVSFVLANIVPSLNEILGLVGASFGYALTFVFPPLFWLAIVKVQGFHRQLHIGVLILAAIVIGIGMYAEIDKLVNAMADDPPFHC